MDEDYLCTAGPVIMPEQKSLEPAHQMKWKNTLIGKLHITEPKSIKPYHVIRDITKEWTDNDISEFSIMKLGDGMFSFHFEDKRDKKWIMDNRPWLVSKDHFKINQYLLLLTEWCPNTPPSKITFSDSYPFWVQVHDIPYEYMSREMGRKIGEGTGHVVLDDDIDDTNTWRMKYLRVRVLVDVTKKLATGCWLVIHKNQHNNVLWLSFKYEELPKIFYRCGIIGHSKYSCSGDFEEDDATNFNPERVGHENELPTVLVEGKVLRVPGKKGYGHWLYDGIDISSDEGEDEEDEDYTDEDDDEESESNDEDYEGLVDDIGVTSSDESYGEEMETQEDEVVKLERRTKQKFDKNMN